MDRHEWDHEGQRLAADTDGTIRRAFPNPDGPTNWWDDVADANEEDAALYGARFGLEAAAREILRLAEEVERCREVHRADASALDDALKEVERLRATLREAAAHARLYQVERLKRKESLAAEVAAARASLDGNAVAAERARIRRELKEAVDEIRQEPAPSDACIFWIKPGDLLAAIDRIVPGED